MRQSRIRHAVDTQERTHQAVHRVGELPQEGLLVVTGLTPDRSAACFPDDGLRRNHTSRVLVLVWRLVRSSGGTTLAEMLCGSPT